jgi:heptosyltransferase-3
MKEIYQYDFNRILILKFRNIGDVLLSTPLLENLKHHYPNAKIDFAINQECIDILSFNPFVDNVICYDRKTIKSLSFLKKLSQEIKFIKQFRGKYGMVINLTEGDKGTMIAYFSKAKIKLGFKSKSGIFSKIKVFDKLGDDKKLQHTVEKDLQFITLLNKKIISKKVQIFWDKNTENKIDEILNKNKINNFVHIHPVSRWMFKCWEDARMAQIIDYFENKKIKVVITGAPNKVENERIDKILKFCKTTPLNLSGKLNLKDLAYLSSRAKLFFGVDTAPMHIAAINTKVVALFGGSKALNWGPWNNENPVKYQNLGIQKNNKHLIFAKDNFDIFYKDGVKKCQGMVDIELAEVLTELRNYDL